MILITACPDRRCAFWVPKHVREAQNVLITAACLLTGPVTLLELLQYHTAAYTCFALTILLMAYGLILNSPRGYQQLFWWRYRRKRTWYARTQGRPRKWTVEKTEERHIFRIRNLIGPSKGRSSLVITTNPHF